MHLSFQHRKDLPQLYCQKQIASMTPSLPVRTGTCTDRAQNSRDLYQPLKQLIERLSEDESFGTTPFTV